MAGNPLWDFSCHVYRAPRVQETLLALQDEHGLDVNLLLAALWWTTQGGELEGEQLDRLLVASAEPRRRVEALRRERRATSRGAPTYGALLASELEAEARVQDILYRELCALALSATPRDGRARALASLERVACIAGRDPCVSSSLFDVLTQAVYPSAATP